MRKPATVVPPVSSQARQEGHLPHQTCGYQPAVRSVKDSTFVMQIRHVTSQTLSLSDPVQKIQPPFSPGLM